MRDDIAGDNLRDIAAFTIEKYEYQTDTTLAAETRRKAMDQMLETLRRRRDEAVTRRRRRFRRELAVVASKALDEAVG